MLNPWTNHVVEQVFYDYFQYQVIGEEEDVSVYDIADHPDFHFRTTDIVIRIWNSENGQNGQTNDCENEVKCEVGLSNK